MISKSYLSSLTEQVFLWSLQNYFHQQHFAIFPTRAVLYPNDLELLLVKSALLARTSSLLNCHKLLDLSE